MCEARQAVEAERSFQHSDEQSWETRLQFKFVKPLFHQSKKISSLLHLILLGYAVDDPEIEHLLFLCCNLLKHMAQSISQKNYFFYIKFCVHLDYLKKISKNFIFPIFYLIITVIYVLIF